MRTLYSWLYKEGTVDSPLIPGTIGVIFGAVLNIWKILRLAMARAPTIVICQASVVQILPLHRLLLPQNALKIVQEGAASTSFATVEVNRVIAKRVL
mmetsp:Transcript_10102/g.15145  ORF Transcript_10102/g.15145 Transcript_10102/m.15145 type:complete len:97 (-) Transcript_10102:682-972(-)